MKTVLSTKKAIEYVEIQAKLDNIAHVWYIIFLNFFFK